MWLNRKESRCARSEIIVQEHVHARNRMHDIRVRSHLCCTLVTRVSGTSFSRSVQMSSRLILERGFLKKTESCFYDVIF